MTFDLYAHIPGLAPFSGAVRHPEVFKPIGKAATEAAHAAVSICRACACPGECLDHGCAKTFADRVLCGLFPKSDYLAPATDAA